MANWLNRKRLQFASFFRHSVLARALGAIADVLGPCIQASYFKWHAAGRAFSIHFLLAAFFDVSPFELRPIYRQVSRIESPGLVDRRSRRSGPQRQTRRGTSTRN